MSDAHVTVQVVDGKAKRHSARVAHGFLRVLEQLSYQSGTVLETAAVLVATAVLHRRQELCGQIAVRGIDIDDVEAGALFPQRSIAVPLAQVPDVRPVHGLSLRRSVPRGHAGRGERVFARQTVARGIPSVPEFHTGERTVAVDSFSHVRQRLHVVLVPQRALGIGIIIGGRMNRAVLGADHGPATLGIYLPRPVERLRPRVSHAGAMRHLVETVLRRYRPDLHGFEEDVVPGVAFHGHSDTATAGNGRSRNTVVVHHRPDTVRRAFVNSLVQTGITCLQARAFETVAPDSLLVKLRPWPGIRSSVPHAPAVALKAAASRNHWISSAGWYSQHPLCAMVYP